MLITSPSLQRWCGKVSEVLWLCAAVAVPLVFNPWGNSVFELPKSILLRALILLMLLTRLIQGIEARSELARPPSDGRVPVATWLTLALAFVLTLSTVFSGNTRASLWGSYERQQGLVTLMAYLVLFLLIGTGVRTHAQVERLWLSLVWGSVPVIVYGLAQGIGLDPLDWRTDAASPVVSTIGRSNFVGSYLVMILPLTLARALLGRRRLRYLLLLSGQLACLALTQARGAWVGTAAAAMVFGLIWSAVTRNRRQAVATLMAALLVTGFVVALNLPDGPLAPLARLPGLDRLSTLSQTNAGSTAARLTTWRATLPLVAARPWLGYGPETMRPVFQRVFPPELVYFQGRHTVVDRAHNLWLDMGMSAGLAGVLAFGLLLAGLGWMAGRELRRNSGGWEQLAWTATAASIVGHITDLQFGFDLTASATVFWIVLGLVLARGRRSSSHTVDRTPTSRQTALLPYLALVLLGLTLIGLLCLRPLSADIAYRQSLLSHPSTERSRWGQRAVRWWPLEPEYHLGLAWNLMQAGDWQAAESQLLTAGRLSPGDPHIRVAQGELYARWAEIEPDRYTQAEAEYRGAVETAPTVARYHTALGLVLIRQGRIEEGLAELERTIELDATDGAAYRHLADVYRMMGRDTDADWARAEAVRWGAD